MSGYWVYDHHALSHNISWRFGNLHKVNPNKTSSVRICIGTVLQMRYVHSECLTNYFKRVGMTSDSGPSAFILSLPGDTFPVMKCANPQPSWSKAYSPFSAHSMLSISWDHLSSKLSH